MARKVDTTFVKIAHIRAVEKLCSYQEKIGKAPGLRTKYFKVVQTMFARWCLNGTEHFNAAPSTLTAILGSELSHESHMALFTTLKDLELISADSTKSRWIIGIRSKRYKSTFIKQYSAMYGLEQIKEKGHDKGQSLDPEALEVSELKDTNHVMNMNLKYYEETIPQLQQKQLAQDSKIAELEAALKAALADTEKLKDRVATLEAEKLDMSLRTTLEDDLELIKPGLLANK